MVLSLFVCHFCPVGGKNDIQGLEYAPKRKSCQCCSFFALRAKNEQPKMGKYNYEYPHCGRLPESSHIQKGMRARMMSSVALDGKIVVVTGGGGGIGSEICAACAAAGAHVVITYNQDEARAKRLAERLPGTGHLVAHAPVDDSAALARLAEQVGTRY